jgi:hypothetical protein
MRSGFEDCQTRGSNCFEGRQPLVSDLSIRHEDLLVVRDRAPPLCDRSLPTAAFGILQPLGGRDGMLDLRTSHDWYYGMSMGSCVDELTLRIYRLPV